MKHAIAKKGVAVVLTAALLAPTSVFAASPSDFSDFPNDWSSEALTAAVENGLLGGVSEGTIAPSGVLTRAQMATIINRAFGATEMASLSGYTDIAAGAWYYNDMAKAVQMGTFVGQGSGKLNPDAAITREEAFCVLSRAFNIDTASTASLSQYTDASEVSSWAQETVAGMIASGYVGGYEDGTLRPQGTITRAEFAAVMDRLVDTYISTKGSVTTDEDGNVLVRTAGVTLEGMTIDGDLILADGVGTGDVTLDGVTVKGRLLVRGGGSESIHITDSTITGGVTMNNPNTATRIVPQNSDIGNISVQSDVIIDGDVGTVNVDKSATVTVAGGNVENIVVAAAAEKAQISVSKGAAVSKVEANAKGVTVSGEGTVQKVAANADNVAVTTPNTEVSAAAGTSGVTAGGETVTAGESATVNNDGTGAGDTTTTPGGSTGGGSSTPSTPDESDAVIEVDTWQELKQAVQTAKNGETIRLTADITDAGSDTTVVDGVSSATVPMESEEGKYFILDGDGHTISAAAGKTFCFLINNSTSETTVVKNLTVDGGSFGTKVGGAFFLENGKIAFDNVTFKNCGARSSMSANGGGALCLNNHGGMPEVTVSNCTFIGNNVGAVGSEGTTGRGGAIYANHFNTSPVTDETATMKLTVENCTFEDNKAAYGGAIAADGNVDLSVTGCTFSGNEGATAADDIYIFEGVSAGKKSMSIYSDVNVTLANNTYSNTSVSDSELTAMNVIYGRYYPAGYTSEPGTAPAGAKDLTFSDVERTTLAKAAAESIAMKEISLGGKTYYYGVAQYNAATNGWVTAFTVSDEPVTATQINGSNVYYYTSDPLTGTLYGTDTLTYAEFYSGNADGAAEYDAVSSATTKKNTLFTNADSTTPVEEEGYQINGVKNVAVQVSADQYVPAAILKAADGLGKSGAAVTNAASITLNESPSTAPALYKPLNTDGNYGALVGDTKATVNSATLDISTSSNWGDYLLKVIEDDTNYLRDGREGEWPIGENILGAIVEATKDGQTIKVGMQHLQNIWVQPYEIAFDVSGKDGNIADTARLEGATINKITYIVPEGLYEYTFTKNNYVKPQHDEATVTASFNEEKTQVTLTGLPEDLQDVTVNIYQNLGHGQKTMIATDQTPDDGVVNLDAKVTVEDDVAYTVQISSSNFADLQTTVQVASETPEPAPGEETKTVTASARVTGGTTAGDYDAKVSVTYNVQTKAIVSVNDDNTECGSNQNWWNMISSYFGTNSPFIGKTAAEIDEVDVITGATLSSNAIKEAVKQALPSNS